MRQWHKGIAKRIIGNTLYLSVPFTWLVDEAKRQKEEWNGPCYIGGPGLMKPTHCKEFQPILLHNPLATFTSRGCPNSCPWCAVPKLEPEFQELNRFRPGPVICDNNFLATSIAHIGAVVEIHKMFPFVDFNQGLDARLFTPEKADLLGRLKCKVRFALDTWGVEHKVKDAIDLARKRTTNDIGVYVLIGFRDTPDDARARLELIRSWGLKPNPMRFQPLDAKQKNEYVAPGWTDTELKRMMRYYSRLNWLEHIPYDEFQFDGQGELFQTGEG